MMRTPMTQALLQSTSRKNAQVVSMDAEVKSAETCKLFNDGVSGNLETTKCADPTCYNISTVEFPAGLFENVESNMKPLWKKGDVVTIFQMHPTNGLIIEGRATVEKSLDRSMEHYMVRFHRKDGKVEREAYERFIDRDGQADSDAYIREFNKRIGYVA